MNETKLLRNNDLKINLLDSLILIDLITIITLGASESILKYIFLTIINLTIILFLKKINYSYTTTFLTGIKRIVFLYIFYAFIASFLGVDLVNSISVVIKHLLFFFILFVFHIILREDNRIIKTLNSMLIASTLVSVTILIDFIINRGNFYIRYGGIIGNINNAGYIIAFAIVLTYILRKTNSKLIFFYFTINSFALILTASRSGILFLLTVIFIYLLGKKKFKISHIILSIFILFISLTLLIIYKDYLFNILFRVSDGTAGRDKLWEASYFMWKDYKLFGVGLGNFNAALPKYLLMTNIGNWEYQQLSVLTSSHSIIIDSFVQLGTIGGISIITIFFLIIMLIIKNIHNKTISKNIITNEVMLAITIGLLARSFFEPFGFLNHAYISVDILYWLVFIAYQNQNIQNSNKF